MKLIQLLFVPTFMLFSSIAFADPALIEIFDADSICIDEGGNFLPSTTTRQIIITNDGEGTVNMKITGVCPTSQSGAVNFDSETFPILVVCNAGSGGAVFFWKYHMRPNGRYHTTCSSHPLDD